MSLENITLGMAFTTFGIIIYTVFNDFAYRRFERFKSDYNIFFEGIVKTEKWIRWPFIKRKEITNLAQGDYLTITLHNPSIKFSIDKKEIEIDFPSIYEDMFDLSLDNYSTLKKYRIKAFEHFMSKKIPTFDYNELQKYLCLLDMWESIFYFRILRFLRNIGIFIIILGFVIIVNPIGFLISSFG